MGCVLVSTFTGTQQGSNIRHESSLVMEQDKPSTDIIAIDDAAGIEIKYKFHSVCQELKSPTYTGDFISINILNGEE